jgi:hypothetical protein
MVSVAMRAANGIHIVQHHAQVLIGLAKTKQNTIAHIFFVCFATEKRMK